MSVVITEQVIVPTTAPPYKLVRSISDWLRRKSPPPAEEPAAFHTYFDSELPARAEFAKQMLAYSDGIDAILLALESSEDAYEVLALMKQYEEHRASRPITPAFEYAPEEYETAKREYLDSMRQKYPLCEPEDFLKLVNQDLADYARKGPNASKLKAIEKYYKYLGKDDRLIRHAVNRLEMNGISVPDDEDICRNLDLAQACGSMQTIGVVEPVVEPTVAFTVEVVE